MKYFCLDYIKRGEFLFIRRWNCFWASLLRKSIYKIDLKSGLVWILSGQKEVGLQIVWILSGIWNLEAQPYEIISTWHHFVKNHLKFGQKYPDYDWSRFLNGWDYRYGHSLSLTIWKPDHLKSELQKLQISRVFLAA